MIIKMTLYGLKGSGAVFRSKLTTVLLNLGYRPTPADPNVWIRPATNKEGMKYYEVVLCYVDNILVIIHDPMDTISEIQKIFKLKGDKATAPKIYL